LAPLLIPRGNQRPRIGACQLTEGQVPFHNRTPAAHCCFPSRSFALCVHFRTRASMSCCSKRRPRALPCVQLPLLRPYDSEHELETTPETGKGEIQSTRIELGDTQPSAIKEHALTIVLPSTPVWLMCALLLNLAPTVPAPVLLKNNGSPSECCACELLYRLGSL
jgi:hypothetical protein